MYESSEQKDPWNPWCWLNTLNKYSYLVARFDNKVVINEPSPTEVVETCIELNIISFGVKEQHSGLVLLRIFIMVTQLTIYHTRGQSLGQRTMELLTMKVNYRKIYFNIEYKTSVPWSTISVSVSNTFLVNLP